MKNHLNNWIREIYSKIEEIYRLIFYTPKHILLDEDYDAYWRARRAQNMGTINSFQRNRTDWILPKIKDGCSVLDIGCGDGGVLLYLLQNKSITPIAADISDYALEFLQSKGITTIKLDINDFDQVNSLPLVDYIILFEVLEHLSRPERFLQILEKKAKKAIFFSIPNSGYFPYRLRMLSGRFVMQWRLFPGEHLRFWTYRDLKWWLKELGYESRSDIQIYEGIPLLNKIWGSLFGMAFVGEIRTQE